MSDDLDRIGRSGFMLRDKTRSDKYDLRQDAEDLLVDLVSIPSPSRKERAAVEFLTAWMTSHGYKAAIDASGSAVGVRGEGERELVLLGHIDTFPGDIPVRFEGRRLYGRGAVDAKGALAAFAMAGAAVEPPSGTRLVVIGATEEEAATSRGARHALIHYHPFSCIIGEPSGWDRITLAYKGRLLVHWLWRCGFGHSAGPDPSPAEQAVAAWIRLQEEAMEVNQDRKAVFDRLDLSLRGINTRSEGAYGVAEMDIGVRLPPDLGPEEVTERFRAILGEATLRFSGQEPAFVTHKNNSLARAFLRSIRTQHGRPRFVYKTGTSDMNVVGPVWDCPILAYGPGDSSLDHTPDENLDLDEYQRAIRVLIGVLSEMLQAEV